MRQIPSLDGPRTATRRLSEHVGEIMGKEYVKPRLISGCLLLAAVIFVRGRPTMAYAPAGEQVETRCGWFVNPTPANASLYDRDGEWIIGVQGGYQAEGDWPNFGPKQWVETNVHYGYGCACLRLRVNRETNKVIEIKSSRVRPLAVCRRDRSLRRWEFEQ